MISCELKKDIRGILYLDDSSDLQSRLLVIDENDHKSDTPRNSFYSLKTTSDYIIKKPSIGLDRKERIAYMNMLVSFLKKQSMVTKTELPIGYYREKRKLAGLIIRYYQKGKSLDRIIKEGNIGELKKYYSHNEDEIQNLFMLFDEYLDCLYELYKSDIYYLDAVLNNIVLDDNQVRIIDFEPSQVYTSFANNRIRNTVFSRYIDLVGVVLSNYNLFNDSIEAQLALSKFAVDGYDEAKQFLRTLEKSTREI